MKFKFNFPNIPIEERLDVLCSTCNDVIDISEAWIINQRKKIYQCKTCHGFELNKENGCII